MSDRPEVFISAASKDLRTARQIVRDGLLTLGYVPVVQEHFAPDYRGVRQMLREKITECDAVVHLIGTCFGFEPQHRAEGEERRSFAQMEYDIARELGKPVYVFVCGPEFEYDPHESEPPDLRELQDAHREKVLAGDPLHVSVRNLHELELRTRELQRQSEKLRYKQSAARRVLYAAVALTLIVSAVSFFVSWQQQRRRDDSVELVRRTEEQLLTARRQIEQMQSALDRQALLTQQILEKVANTKDSSSGPDGSQQAIATARKAVADAEGLTAEELQQRLSKEGTDVAQILAQIVQLRQGSDAGAERWRLLEMEAHEKLGDTARAAGNYREAPVHYRAALNLADLEAKPLEWCAIAQKLEVALWDLRQLQEAEPLAQQIVDLRTSLQGPEHTDTLGALNNLANLLKANGDFDGAATRYQKVLTAREAQLGPDDPETLQTLNNLATLYAETGKLEQAEPLFRKSFEAHERHFGPDHRDTLICLGNLANLARDRGDNAAAKPLFERVFNAQERTLGPDHRDTLATANNLALVLGKTGDAAAALSLADRVIAGYEKIYGPENPQTLSAVDTKADIAADAGEFATAEKLYARAITGLEKAFPAGHPYLADAAHDCAVLYQKMGRNAEAIDMASRAVAAARGSLPKGHPDLDRCEELLRKLKGSAE